MVLIGAASCERDIATLDPAPFPPEAEVFYDGFGPGVQFSAFGGSKVDALAIEHDEVYRGTAALKFTIPAPTDPSGGYAGGVFYSEVPRDLTGFDALTFWARASTAATVNTIGIGNDNTGGSRYPATIEGLPFSTRWTKYVVPFPLPSRLGQETGLFLIAEGSEYPVGYDIFFDDVQFERLGTIINPRPAIATQTVNGEVGGTLSVGGTQVTFDVGGKDQTVLAAPAYFTFTSSNSGVASVTPDGSISLISSGTATITATLGSTAAAGAVTVNVTAPPTGAPPTPAHPAGDVISLFSDAYDDVPVDTWSAVWDQADVEDIRVAGNPVKKYTNLAYAGIEFTSQPINAASMTDLHVDLWTNDPSAFRIKLVDFGAATGSSEAATTRNTRSPSIRARCHPSPAGAWNTLDIPLSAFTGLLNRGNLAQMIISGSSPTVYLDNIYFFTTRPPPPSAPSEAAPTPTHAAADVVSLFSDAYKDVGGGHLVGFLGPGRCRGRADRGGRRQEVQQPRLRRHRVHLGDARRHRDDALPHGSLDAGSNGRPGGLPDQARRLRSRWRLRRRGRHRTRIDVECNVRSAAGDGNVGELRHCPDGVHGADDTRAPCPDDHLR